MGRFDSIFDIEGRLSDFEIQCIFEWWGDPLRNVLDQSIEKDVFEPYQNGEHIHALVRMETYVSILTLRMVLERYPSKVISPSKKVTKGWMIEGATIIKSLRGSPNLEWFRECFGEQVPNKLIKDLSLIRKLRNAYAHRLTPVRDIFSNDEHKKILQAMRDTWQDLRNEYCKIVTGDKP